MHSALHPRRFRIALPASVLTLGVDSSAIVLLQELTGEKTVCVPRAAWSSPEQFSRLLDACVVFPVPADTEPAELSALMGLRQRFPNVPVIALYYPSRSSCQAVLQLGAAGVTQIVTAEPVLRPAELQAALVRAHGDGVTIRLWRQCAFELPEAMVPVLKAALRLAREPLSADRLASATGMHQRTLRKYCVQKGLPSPQWIIGWARLLLAGYYMDEPGRTVAQVADILSFPSACALRNQLRRYTSVASRALRAGGITQALARTMEQVVHAHAEIAASGSSAERTAP